ncbi:hypothetical protein GCM10028791_22840 [Echinicola sediminis]
MDSLAIVNQDQLDKGKDMMQTEIHYAAQMDSMLNVVYQDLMHQISYAQKDTLRSAQRKWLDKRDRYFDQVVRELKVDLGGMIDVNSRDFKMMIYSKRAEFIRKRIGELIE